MVSQTERPTLADSLACQTNGAGRAGFSPGLWLLVPIAICSCQGLAK
jgi:hypothetical protein